MLWREQTTGRLLFLSSFIPKPAPVTRNLCGHCSERAFTTGDTQPLSIVPNQQSFNFCLTGLEVARATEPAEKDPSQRIRCWMQSRFLLYGLVVRIKSSLQLEKRRLAPEVLSVDSDQQVDPTQSHSFVIPCYWLFRRVPCVFRSMKVHVAKRKLETKAIQFLDTKEWDFTDDTSKNFTVV